MSLLRKVLDGASDTTSWYVAIPILTNRVLLYDLLLAGLLALPGTAGFTLLVQLATGGGVNAQQAWVALRAGVLVCAALLAAFGVIGGLILRNRYLACYALSGAVLSCEILSCRFEGNWKDFCRTRPWRADPPSAVKRSRLTTIRIDRLRSIRRVPELFLLVLAGLEGGAHMKVYCPDAALYERLDDHIAEVSGIRS